MPRDDFISQKTKQVAHFELVFFKLLCKVDRLSNQCVMDLPMFFDIRKTCLAYKGFFIPKMLHDVRQQSLDQHHDVGFWLLCKDRRE